MPRRLSLKDAIDSARRKKGVCLSKQYVNSIIPMLWRCQHGHEWEMRYASIRQGYWCPECGRAEKLSNCRSFAKKKKGDCLSGQYINNNTKLNWICEAGHKWSATPANIFRGHWCPECANQGRYTLERLREIAQKRGGECLSKDCGNARKKLLWKCGNGHEWEATTGNVVAGRWCPECSTGLSERLCRAAFEQLFGKTFSKAYPDWLKNSDGNQLELDGYCQELSIAFEHQGMHHFQMTRRFSKTEAELNKRKRLDREKLGICKKNGVKLVIIPQIGQKDFPISKLKNFIVEECKKFGIHVPNDNVDIDFRFAYSPDDKIFRSKLEEIASMRGGHLVSELYKGSSHPLEWECNIGHRWFAPPNRILSQGSWCPYCAGRNKTIKDMHTLAENNHGLCLSKRYEGKNKKLEWKCVVGHQFKMAPNSVIQGHWCPQCAGNARLSLPQLQQIAQSKGGLLLSDNYINATSGVAP